MAVVKKFEDLRACQEARMLHRSMRRITGSLTFQNERKLQLQSRDAAESVMANIAEGFNRYRPREFAQFLSIAKGSCAEVQSHLYAMLDGDLISQEVFDGCYAEADRVLGVVTRLRSRLRPMAPST